MDNTKIIAFDREGFLKRMMNDWALCAEVLEDYLSDIPNQLIDIDSSLEEKDFLRLNGIAHSIKGASANVGAEGMRSVAFKLEQASEPGDSPEIIPLVADLRSEFKKLIPILKSHLGAS